MGIRFDKDTRRATNGPMIFFADPSAEISLGDEIRGAIESRLSFYSYRRPGDMMITFGSSEGTVEGIGTPGFVIAPFNPDEPYLTIPYKPVSDMKKSAEISPRPFPSASTTKEEHHQEVIEIKEMVRSNGYGKAVAARVSVFNTPMDIGKKFSDLCRKNPRAFVFCFSTPETGCWIGATPELLLESDAYGLSTMALAGTRPASAPGEWDSKNIEEQKMVTDYILEVMERHHLNPAMAQTITKVAGNVEHLCTPIKVSVNSGFDAERLSSLLHDLSPTPALAGLPRQEALDIIRSCENFDRAYYGGFCGPYRSPSDFSFYVTLRCALVEQQRFAIFIGGGITSESNPDDEWMETEAKAKTMIGF